MHMRWWLRVAVDGGRGRGAVVVTPAAGRTPGRQENPAASLERDRRWFLEVSKKQTIDKIYDRNPGRAAQPSTAWGTRRMRVVGIGRFN